METINYYQILDISRNATAQDIKKAYRHLARVFHPDVNNEPNATEKFKSISEAYDVLGDEARRRIYDQTGNADFGDYHAASGQAFRPFQANDGMKRCHMGKCSGIEAIFRRGASYKRRKAAEKLRKTGRSINERP